MRPYRDSIKVFSVHELIRSENNHENILFMYWGVILFEIPVLISLHFLFNDLVSPWLSTNDLS
jgi:hypothetical protein